MDASTNPLDRRLLFDHPDPYPLFRMLRQSQPVFATEHLGRPTFRLTTYDDCLPNLRLDPVAPPPAITGLAFRSPKRLAVLVE